MSLGFSQIIGAIEAEIKTDYLPGAIQWADKERHGAWSAAIDRFDKALAVAIERQDYTLAKLEGDFYRQTVLKLLADYKRSKQLDESDSFLASMGKRRKGTA